MKLIKLNDKLKYVKKVLKTPYHIFHVTTDKQISVLFEDKYGKRFSFTGKTIFNSLEIAEEYVRNEIQAGSLFEPKSLEKKDELEEKQIENEGH